MANNLLWTLYLSMSKAIFTSTCLPGSVKENVTETEMVARLETDSPIITCVWRARFPASFLGPRGEAKSRATGPQWHWVSLLWSPACFYETRSENRSLEIHQQIWLKDMAGFKKRNPPFTSGFKSFPSLRNPSAMQATTAASGGTIAAAVAAGIVDVTAADAPEPAALSSLWGQASDSSASCPRRPKA